MDSSPRWFIGFLVLFFFMTLVGNITEGVAIYTNAQVAKMNAMAAIETSQAVDPTVGGELTYGGLTKTALDTFIKAITADYAWLYKIDTTKTQAQCLVTAGAKWNTTAGTCRVPTVYAWIWYLLYYPIVIGMLLSLALTIARLIRGV